MILLASETRAKFISYFFFFNIVIFLLLISNRELIREINKTKDAGTTCTFDSITNGYIVYSKYQWCILFAGKVVSILSLEIRNEILTSLK